MSKATNKAATQAGDRFDALFGTKDGERSVSGGFKMLAHSRISTRPQVRRTFPPAEMEELGASIRALRAQNAGIEGTGILQALLVCPIEEGGYSLIAGERRFRASQSEGLPEVPCVVVPSVSPGMTRLLQLIENSQRSAPPVLEEAQALRETMDEQSLSVRDAARMIGKDKGYIENRLRLLKTGADIQEMVSVRTDTLQHARYIEAVSDPVLRADLVRAVLDEGISAREVERRIETASSGSLSVRTDTPDVGVASSPTDQVSVRTDTSGSNKGRAPALSHALRHALKAAEEMRRAVLDGVGDEAERQKTREVLVLLREALSQAERALGEA